jgi:hypothetical protein
MPPQRDKVRHWRDKAEWARVSASQMTDTLSRRIMLGIVASYERLASLAERHVPDPGAAAAPNRLRPLRSDPAP